MIKLSELKNDAKIIDENNCIYTVEDVKNDLLYFKDKEKKLYTTTEYQASVDAISMLEDALECEDNNMYEDWYERVKEDITDEDVQRIQAVFDEILSRSRDQNIAYYQDEEIEVDYE